MRSWGGPLLAVVLASCFGGPKMPSNTTSTSTDTAFGEGEGSGGEGEDGGSDTQDSAAPASPHWLSWDGEETLSVDVLADGTVECSFHWRTSGLHRADPCEGCDFDFDVVGEADAEASTCEGAAGFRSRRWWNNGQLYGEDDLVAEGTLDANSVTARRYTLELDPTYGAPVAMTWELSAVLR